MIHIQISDSFTKLVEPEVIRNAGNISLSFLYLRTKTNLSVVVEDDFVLCDMNLKFRGNNNLTDVLAFPSGETDPDSGEIYLGDVILSYPAAERQAGAAKHSIDTEIQILVVHGILHLAGFDHDTQINKYAMWDLQEKILTHIGILRTSHPM
jgi:probable rRNA maturation factor